MTVLEVIQRSAEFLARKGVESPRLQVELLLAHVLKVPRLRLYLDFERRLSEAELDSVRQMVKRRGGREPLQHIVGSTSFCGFEIKVDANVLVPRPETEVLAERAWQFLQQRSQVQSEPVSALDFGTGSGCLAVALARQVPLAQIAAVEISSAALKLARENAACHHVLERIQFFEGDGFNAVPKDRSFDLIVANPPYIPSSEIEHLAPEVRDYDPRLALDGGGDGLDFARRLAQEASSFLRPDGRLMAEFGDGQEQAIGKILQERHWQVEALIPDLSGRPRIVVARPAES